MTFRVEKVIEEAVSNTRSRLLQDYMVNDPDGKVKELAAKMYAELLAKDPKIPAHIANHRVGEQLCERISILVLQAKHNRR